MPVDLVQQRGGTGVYLSDAETPRFLQPVGDLPDFVLSTENCGAVLDAKQIKLVKYTADTDHGEDPYRRPGRAPHPACDPHE